jgi:hypothetical protein
MIKVEAVEAQDRRDTTILALTQVTVAMDLVHQ